MRVLAVFVGICLAVVAALPGVIRSSAADVISDINTCADLAEQRRNDEAIALCTQALQAPGLSAKQEAAALANRGGAYEQKGELESALRDLDRAIELKPDVAMAHVNRGMVYDDMKQYRRAILDYDEALRLDPALFQGYLDRGAAYYMIDEYDRAIADYTQAIALKPDADAYINRAYAFDLKRAYEKAILDYAAALKLSPEDPNAESLLCFDLALVGRAAEGLPHCDRSLSMQIDDPEYFKNRAYAHLRLGALDAAMADWTSAVDLDPNYADYRFGRAYTHERKGNVAAAAEDYAAARSMDQDIDAYMRNIGIVPGAAEIMPEL